MSELDALTSACGLADLGHITGQIGCRVGMKVWLKLS